MPHLYKSAIKTSRFINLSEFDQFIHHRYRDESGNDCLYLEVGAVKRLTAYLDRLESLLKRIAGSNDPPLLQHRRGYGLSNLSRDLVCTLFDADSEASQAVCEGRRLSPWTRLGLALAKKWTPKLRPYSSISDGLNGLTMSHEYPRQAMTRIVNIIRRVCRSKRFRNLVNNDTRNANENYISCANLMIDLLSSHARLLILRIDLYFEGDAKVFSESKAADKAYNKFMRHMSTRKIVPKVLGYIAKRENGLERRIHYHVLVALDGDKHRQAFAMTEKLGQFWVRDCVGTKGLASYFNCWKRRTEYEFNSIGLLHYSNSRMLMGLRLALEYICKEGAHILVGDEMGRNLRKSIKPKQSGGDNRRGPPRKYGNELAVAKQVLLTSAKFGTRSLGDERVRV